MQLNRIFLLFIIKNFFLSLVDGYLTLSELTSSVNYNASEIPQNSDSQSGERTPLKITVSFEIEYIDHIFEESGVVVTVDSKVKLSWFDSRLRYTDKDLQNYIYTKDDKAIWTPRLVWLTETMAKSSVPYTYFRIYPNALVAEVVRVSIELKPSLSSGTFGGFFIRLLSLNYTEESLTLQWNETNAMSIDSTHERPYITLLPDFQARSCHLNVTRLSRRQGGAHSCLEIGLENTEQKSSFAFMVYGPAIALVIISWSCFWMDPSSALGRAAVLLASLLHLFIQKTSITKDLFQQKKDLTVIAFLDGCIGFIFVAFLQAVWISYLYRITRIPGVTRLSSATTIQEEEGEGIVETSGGEGNTLRNHFHFPRIWLNRFPSTPDAINAICRVGFPLCFVIFVCVFFAVVNRNN